jgi:DNA-binding FadR family transcriptional regulator
VLSDSSTAAPFKAVARQNAVEAVRGRLLEHLAGGEVRVGDRLPSEHALAQAFCVSRSVVREALGMLRAWGLVEPRNGRGTYVRAIAPRGTPLTLSDSYSSDDLNEVRRHIEIPGAGLAARRRTVADLRRLGENLDALARCESTTRWATLDVGFHTLLAEAAHNPIHLRVLAGLAGLHHEQSTQVLAAKGRDGRSLGEHRAILAAVRASNERDAMAAMAQHLDRTRIESHGLGTRAVASGA